MFRENVLIALTILITILALSFVILLTVFMQMHQEQEKLKRFEADVREEIIIPENSNNSVLFVDDERNLAFINDNRKNDMSKVDESKLDKRQTQAKTRATTSTTTTENPDDEGFYTDDDFFLQFPQPPPGSRRIPYNLYKRNGHVILKVPPSINLSEDMDHVRKVIEQLNELYHIQKERDEEQNQYKINGYKPWYPLTKDAQEGQIWIRNAQPLSTTTTTPRSVKKEPFDDRLIFDIVSENRRRRLGLDPFGLLGKRKKRSLDTKGNSRKRYFRRNAKIRSMKS